MPIGKCAGYQFIHQFRVLGLGLGGLYLTEGARASRYRSGCTHMACMPHFKKLLEVLRQNWSLGLGFRA